LRRPKLCLIALPLERAADTLATSAAPVARAVSTSAHGLLFKMGQLLAAIVTADPRCQLWCRQSARWFHDRALARHPLRFNRIKPRTLDRQLAEQNPHAPFTLRGAVTYDQGYMSPETIGERVKVRGRGGTILQPGIDLLEKAEDFPDERPDSDYHRRVL
jgi:hypothetical protein